MTIQRTFWRSDIEMMQYAPQFMTGDIRLHPDAALTATDLRESIVADGKIKPLPVGSRFGRLVVTGQPSGGKHSKIDVTCDCGTSKTVRVDHLRSGKVVACGCYMRERQSEANTKHGMHNSRTWIAWRAMHTRCGNPNVPSYKDYGARGIVVCERWRSFEMFLEDMGECPPGHTLERKNVNGTYAPDNCEWASRVQQARNKRNTVWVTFNGQRVSVAEAMERVRLPRFYYDNRRKKMHGASPQQIFDAVLLEVAHGP